jgi:uncharacterized membrane protein
MRDKIGMWLAGLLYLATLYVLVRPNSKGPALVGTVLGTFADLVRGVSGQTYDSSTNKWSAAQ